MLDKPLDELYIVYTQKTTPMEITDEQILKNMTKRDRRRIERRVLFNCLVEEIYRMSKEKGIPLADVSRACGYAPYTLTSGISQTKTTGRINMKLVLTAHSYLTEIDPATD